LTSSVTAPAPTSTAPPPATTTSPTATPIYDQLLRDMQQRRQPTTPTDAAPNATVSESAATPKTSDLDGDE